MNGFTISPTLNKNKVFLLQKSEVEKRLDPYFYIPKFKELEAKLKTKKTKKISEIALNIFSGSTPLSKGDAYTLDKNEGIPFVRSGDFNIDGSINFDDLIYLKSEIHSTQLKSSQLKNNDLLFAIVGATIGKVGIYKSEKSANINQAICAVRLKEGLNIDYLNAYFQTSLGQSLIDRIKRPVARANVNLDEIATLPIILPDEETQGKIINIFNLALLQKKQNELQAEKLLASIDDYLLKELGITLPTPPENILKNRIYKTSIKEISGNRFDPAFHQIHFHQLVEAIENSRFSKTKLGVHLSVISYGASFNNFYVDTGIPLLRIKDLKRNEISIDEVVYLPESARTQLGNCFVKANDFLITRSGTIGLVAIVPKEIDGFAFGSFMIKFNLKDTAKVHREYLSYFLNCGIIAKLVERNKIGAIQGNITIPIIKALPLVLPSLDKQKEIAEHISAIRKQAQQLKEKTNEALKKAGEEIEKILIE